MPNSVPPRCAAWSRCLHFAIKPTRSKSRTNFIAFPAVIGTKNNNRFKSGLTMHMYDMTPRKAPEAPIEAALDFITNLCAMLVREEKTPADKNKPISCSGPNKFVAVCENE